MPNWSARSPAPSWCSSSASRSPGATRPAPKRPDALPPPIPLERHEMDITEIDKFADLLPFLEMVLADFALIDILSGAFWVAVSKIMFANVVLSGDNAVVIAMACRNLPDRQRTRAVLFGSL